jgi:hypothetical protein
MAQDRAQDPGQVVTAARVKPTARTVAMSDTTNVMSSERSIGMTMPW